MDKIIEAAKAGKEIINEVNEKSGLFMQLLNSIPWYRANKLLIESIENDPNLDDVQKAALLYQHKAVKKAAINLNQIYNSADLFLKCKGTSFKEKKINDDWFGMYNDIAKNISDEEMQIIWAKILASECVKPNSISKKLLSILQVIDTETAKVFSNLCRYGIYLDFNDGRHFFFIPSKDMTDVDNVQSLKDYASISYVDELNLKSLGLIELDNNDKFRLENKSDMVFHYYNATIHVKSNGNNVNIGKIMFTNYGNQLANVLYDDAENQKPDGRFLEFLIEYFRSCEKYEVRIVE